jgi:hypothetical protein
VPTTEADVAKYGGMAIGAAAIACSVVPGIGTAACAIGAGIATLLTSIGVAITAGERDTFNADNDLRGPSSEALLTLIRLCPAVAWWGIDNTGGDPLQSSQLVLWLRVASGEVPVGVAKNTGKLSNPSNHSGNCQDNPYMCQADPAEPLSSQATQAKMLVNYGKWLASGSDPKKLSAMVPSDYHTPAAAKLLLSAIRQFPVPFQNVLAWDFAKDHKRELQESIRHARRIAGETGPDDTLALLFGDVTVGSVKDPKMSGGFTDGLGFGIGLLPGLLIGASLLSLAAVYWPRKRP